MAVPPHNNNGYSKAQQHHDMDMAYWDALLRGHVAALEYHAKMLKSYRTFLTAAPDLPQPNGDRNTSDSTAQSLGDDERSIAIETLTAMLARNNAAHADATTCMAILRQRANLRRAFFHENAADRYAGAAAAQQAQTASDRNNLQPVRAKRRAAGSSSSTDADKDANASEQVQPPSKRQRVTRSPALEPRTTTATAAPLTTPTVTTAPIRTTPITTTLLTTAPITPTQQTHAAAPVEYDDLTAEVEARLERLEQRRREERERERGGGVSLGRGKRKRRSLSEGAAGDYVGRREYGDGGLEGEGRMEGGTERMGKRRKGWDGWE